MREAACNIAVSIAACLTLPGRDLVLCTKGGGWTGSIPGEREVPESGVVVLESDLGPRSLLVVDLGMGAAGTWWGAGWTEDCCSCAMATVYVCVCVLCVCACVYALLCTCGGRTLHAKCDLNNKHMNIKLLLKQVNMC